MASFRVFEPVVTDTTSAPSNFMRSTFTAWRTVSSSPMYTTQGRPNSAHAVAVATPCWPAPVSAMMRPFPSRLASNTWPIVLLILCAPVCARSSRFSQMRYPS